MPNAHIEPYWRHYIGGRWVDSEDGARLEVENPATGETLAEVACAGPADVDRAVAAAREMADGRALQDMPPAERAEMLRRVAREIRALEEEIGLLECLDGGKPLSTARAQADDSASYFDYYAGLADKLEGRSIPLGPGYVDYTVAIPFGVSAHVIPWNYPLAIACRSISCALAAGNAVVVKAPELAPLSVHLLGRALKRADVPGGAVSILCGEGRGAGSALVHHEGIDHIVFTGSVATGRQILRAAAERIVPAVVELGGKSAAVVYADADLDRAVDSIASGIFGHAGQTCSAPSRIVAERPIRAELVERLAERARRLSVGPGIDDHDVTPLISEPQLGRVEAFCRGAVAEGARAVTGGERVAGRAGHFMQPTVFDQVERAHRIAQEEVFGPVVAVQEFGGPREAARLANGTEYGLCAGVFTRDLELAHWTADRLIAGQVYVNEWFAGGVATPFGGTKRSGYGREKGQEAILSYVQTKNVAIRLGGGGT